MGHNPADDHNAIRIWGKDIDVTSLADGDLLKYVSATAKWTRSPSSNFIAATALDTDGTLAANSDSKVASQKATKTYADTQDASNLTTAENYTDTAVHKTAWDTYTPALTAATTNPTLGSGGAFEQKGRYVQIGHLVVVKINIRFGSSGAAAGSGTYSVSLPVTAEASLMSYGQVAMGWGRALDNSAGFDAMFFPQFNSNTTFTLVYYPGIAGTAGRQLASDSLPWTWAASDTVYAGTVIYEAA